MPSQHPRTSKKEVLFIMPRKTPGSAWRWRRLFSRSESREAPGSCRESFTISGRKPRRSAVGVNASPERSGGDNPDGSPISGRGFLPLEEYPRSEERRVGKEGRSRG